jgi:translation initiation factor 1
MEKLNSLADLKKLFPEAEGTYQHPKKVEPDFKKQYLEAHFSNKGRGGKTVTIIKGFIGSYEELKSMAKSIKLKFSVGGSIKGSDIVIQGNIRDKIVKFLISKGHKIKRIGG